MRRFFLILMPICLFIGCGADGSTTNKNSQKEVSEYSQRAQDQNKSVFERMRFENGDVITSNNGSSEQEISLDR
ncbi:hypothetical protein [Fluviispira multicolorata]|uniref:Lipoprotein n=1 Tax=Fluviispira multicolorata TaxID=2654512 RepID=A0A833N6B6_9BACT|nr:hypothetical protein [Fluviispira multicolorata]KAB8029853.1 hypothetical protein GCL57_09960 [Fluviispira multicolorata]